MIADKPSERVAGDKAGSESFVTRGFVFTCLAAFFFFFSNNTIVPAFPLYIARLGGSDFEVGLVLSLFSLAALFARPFVGQLVDKGHLRALLVFGGLNNLISCVAFIFLPTVWLVGAVRMFNGLGLASFATAAGASVADLAPARRRGEAVGIYGIVGPLAMAVGPAIGAAAMSRSGFEGLFIGSAVLALISLAMSAQVKPPEKERAAAVGFKLINREALLPAAVLASGTFTLGAVFAFVPLYVARENLGDVGLFFTVYAASMTLIRIATGKLSDIYGRVVVIVPSLVAMGLASFFLAVSPGYWSLLVAGALIGGGVGAAFPAVMALAIDRANAAERGSATATLLAAFDVGISAGTFVDGFILQWGGFAAMFAANGVVPLIGVIGFLMAARIGHASRTRSVAESGTGFHIER